MRIAWLGPPPSDDPGAPTVATLLIEGLAHAGIEVDVYAATGQTQVSQCLYSPGPGLAAAQNPQQITCVSRLLVRKGVDMPMPADRVHARASARSEAVS
jgi:hypothetical protein